MIHHQAATGLHEIEIAEGVDLCDAGVFHQDRVARAERIAATFRTLSTSDR